MKTTENHQFKKIIFSIAVISGVVWLNYIIMQAIADEIRETRSSLVQHEHRISILEDRANSPVNAPGKRNAGQP